MPNYYQPEIETMPYEQLRQLQSERLVKQVQHVWDSVPYYRKKMEQKGVTPEDIHGLEDLHKLPFLCKDDLREAYPYGLLGKPLNECVRIHSTSGTTGKRVVAFYTQHDIDLWDDCCAVPSPLRVRPGRMCAILPTASACSPAVPVSTAVPTRWAA